MTTMMNGDGEYDRMKEVKQFDESKIGVKGLVDSGITSIPRFFVHPPETRPLISTTIISDEKNIVPVIDLSGANSDRRSIIVDQIRIALTSLGVFQVVNHGIPCDVLDRTITSIKAFHEQPQGIKSRYYGREFGRGVSFFSNRDLFKSKAASWKDTLQTKLPPNSDQLPEICRRELIEWDQQMNGLGELLMQMMSEGLGSEPGRLKGLTFLEARVMLGHYYPYCPEPDLTVGTASHTDPAVLTMLLQDQIGGLQVKSGDDWIDVKPIPGALTINVGAILQIVSNGEYKSVEHRVLANPCREPRTSIAVFFIPGKRDDDEFYGPLPELISLEKPVLYRSFIVSDFMRRFLTKDLEGKSLINYYKLSRGKASTTI